jgi:hypothetical protein
MSGRATDNTSLADQAQRLVGNVICQVKPGSPQLFNRRASRRNETDLLRQNDQTECPSDSDFEGLGAAPRITIVPNRFAVRIGQGES